MSLASLRLLQCALEERNDVSTSLDVRHFIIGDDTHQTDRPEELLIRTADNEDVELGLYIDPAVLEALEQDAPHQRLHGGNLDNFCVALEGVSHFIYLVWRARQRCAVSALELEVQAEVDKFVCAWMMLVDQGGAVHPTAKALLRALFGSYQLRACVPRDEADRYIVASRAAAQFCEKLAARHRSATDLRRIGREVKTYYRLGLQDKLRAG